MTQQRISFLGLPLDSGVTIDSLCALLGKHDGPNLVTFVDARSWDLAKKQPDYITQLEHMTMVLPATLDISCAAKKITGHDSAPICFETHSLAAPLFKTVAQNNNTLMLVGGQPAYDERVHDKLNVHYPALNIIATVNGYGDIMQKVALVIEKNPDCVLVDLAPSKAEGFLIALRDAGYKGLAIACSGFFEETLLDDEFYPSWVKRWNLFYAYRLAVDPKTQLTPFLKAYPAFAMPAAKALTKKYLPQKAA